MKTKKLTLLLQLIVSVLPLGYLLLIWNQLAESLPMHYNIHNQPDRMGSKIELLFLMLFMSTIGFGVGMLMRYLSKIDPKRNIQHNEGLMNKVSWTVVIFISVISCYIVYVSLNYSKSQNSSISGKMIEILICLIFVVLGNFMNNVKPNYFVGIRTPWNLENEENWRKTHHLGSKLMFFGGLLMIALIILLPTPISAYVLLIGLVPIVLIPFVYSYLLFKKEKH